MIRSVVLFAVIWLALLTVRQEVSDGSKSRSTALDNGIPSQTTSKINVADATEWKTKANQCARQDIKSLQLQSLLKSQSKEDEHILQFFNGLCNGTYIEMGGLDGVQYSNSYVFSKAFGWKGFMAELNPDSHSKLVVNRPNELVPPVHAAVCNSAREVHWVSHPRIPSVNGVWEFVDEDFRQKWWRGLKQDESQTIQCKPLKDLLEDHLPSTQYFDFFSLDLEGAEYAALSSLDFSRVAFGIILIEDQSEVNLRKEMATRTLLEKNGYRYLYEKYRSSWYINENFHEIYESVLDSGGA